MTDNQRQLSLLTSKATYIFDLDGTLADIRKRLSLANKGEEMDWSEFFNPDYIKYDKPKDDVINMARIIYEEGFNVVIFSGRLDTTREKTIEWLDNHSVDYHALIMRPQATDEFTNDAVLKERWLEELVDTRLSGHMGLIWGVYDDRNQVVDMWRSKGLTCYQVAKGDF